MPPHWPCRGCAPKWPLRDTWSTTACHLVKKRLCTDACGCCAGKYSPTAVLAAGAEANAVEYNWRVYRTLDGTSPFDTGRKCQNFDLALPLGSWPTWWARAADNADSRYVIRSFIWGTHGLVVDNGKAYYTASQGSSAGSLYTSGALSGLSIRENYQDRLTYMVKYCNLLILISKKGRLPCTACPAGESRDYGARVREAYVCEFGEDRMSTREIGSGHTRPLIWLRPLSLPSLMHTDVPDWCMQPFCGVVEPAPKRAHLLILVVGAQASTPIQQERLCAPTAVQVRVDPCI
jgi:hypothetical protein